MTGRRQELEAALVRWARRPPGLDPAHARTRVLARLPRGASRPRRRIGRYALVALAALALALALVLIPGQPPTPAPELAPTAGSRMIVHQLRSGRKLYIVLPSPPAGEITHQDKETSS